MSKNNVIELREFDYVFASNHRNSSDPRFNRVSPEDFKQIREFLAKYIDTSIKNNCNFNPYDFMTLSSKKGYGEVIQFRNYVGVIQLPNGLQIEVLPKFQFKDDQTEHGVKYPKTKRVFTMMLMSLRAPDGKLYTQTNLGIQKASLFELFINLYVHQVSDLVKKGLRSNYQQISENLNHFVGRLLIKEQITKNTLHKEKFYVIHDIYSLNRPENKLIKSCLGKLLKLTHSSKNKQQLKILIDDFENVSESTNYEADFKQIQKNRLMSSYDQILDWTEVFLNNKGFSTFHGKKEANAILFPMEKVFESFVARQFQKIIKKDPGFQNFSISIQDKGKYLFNRIDGKSKQQFSLRPDIVIYEYVANEKVPKFILDTKWKNIGADKGHLGGISQSDLYQMLAYTQRYNTPYVFLIFPDNDNSKLAFSRLSFVQQQNTRPDIDLKIEKLDMQTLSKQNGKESLLKEVIDTISDLITQSPQSSSISD